MFLWPGFKPLCKACNNDLLLKPLRNYLLYLQKQSQSWTFWHFIFKPFFSTDWPSLVMFLRTSQWMDLNLNEIIHNAYNFYNMLVFMAVFFVYSQILIEYYPLTACQSFFQGHYACFFAIIFIVTFVVTCSCLSLVI